jgi:hypothetical protein
MDRGDSSDANALGVIRGWVVSRNRDYGQSYYGVMVVASAVPDANLTLYAKLWFNVVTLPMGAGVFFDSLTSGHSLTPSRVATGRA